ncbi:IS4 family transposase ISDre1 [Paenibacillus plantiphilus]|uniref:IS4 family transposase ISDre1 n=1 Tax=Paenibacillus plantiphilus TaxID=2905650 RepID=A0ABN8GGZ0_9BACL|nr:IS4 family transposase [Paenibacillus plantiphilus]CAH1209076.1 IS4 family transposase ISDre1 [Paenibacillus plantiphilus]
MDNVTQLSVIRQCLSLLPVDVNERLLFDHYAKKLTIHKTIRTFVAAQLQHWSSYAEMESTIRAHPELQRVLGFTSISGSQLSRKLDQIPTELLEDLFHQCATRLKQLKSQPNPGQLAFPWKLRILDSTSLRLPLQLGDWARMSRYESGVKMHLRLLATSPDEAIPEAMIPTTVNVNDRTPAIDLVVESDAIYVMDRGYDKYTRMDEWVERKILFVLRVRDRTFTKEVEVYPVPEHTNIVRDAKVLVGASPSYMEHPLRLVEFHDEQGRLYRILTSVWDQSAEEITHMYKCRWQIELFFKWLKQHVRLVKLYSFKPQAIWNQLYLALITSLLVHEIKRMTQTRRSPWEVLRLLRIYFFKEWSAYESELHRKPSKTSSGRQKSAMKPAISVRTTIGILKPPTQKYS